MGETKESGDTNPILKSDKHFGFRYWQVLPGREMKFRDVTEIYEGLLKSSSGLEKKVKEISLNGYNGFLGLDLYCSTEIGLPYIILSSQRTANEKENFRNPVFEETLDAMTEGRAENYAQHLNNRSRNYSLQDIEGLLIHGLNISIQPKRLFPDSEAQHKLPGFDSFMAIVREGNAYGVRIITKSPVKRKIFTNIAEKYLGVELKK